MELIPLPEVVDEEEEAEILSEEQAELLEEKSEALSDAIYKGLLGFMILISLWMMFDGKFPLKSKQVQLVAKESTRDGYVLHTSGFNLEVGEGFCETVNDSFPLTVFYTPFLNIPERIEGQRKNNPLLKIISKNLNTDFTPFYAFLTMSLLLSTIGIFMNDYQGKRAFMAASVFFMAMMLLVILPYLK